MSQSPEDEGACAAPPTREEVYGTERHIVVVMLVGPTRVGKTTFAHDMKDLLEKNYFIDTYIFKDRPYDVLFHQVKELLRHLRVSGNDFQTTFVMIDKNMCDRKSRYQMMALASLYRAHALQVFFQYDFSELLKRNTDSFRFGDTTYEDFLTNVIKSHPPTEFTQFERAMLIPWKYNTYHQFVKLIEITMNLLATPQIPNMTYEIMNYICRSNLIYTNFNEEVLPFMDCFLPGRSIEPNPIDVSSARIEYYLNVLRNLDDFQLRAAFAPRVNLTTGPYVVTITQVESDPGPSNPQEQPTPDAAEAVLPEDEPQPGPSGDNDDPLGEPDPFNFRGRPEAAEIEAAIQWLMQTAEVVARRYQTMQFDFSHLGLNDAPSTESSDSTPRSDSSSTSASQNNDNVLPIQQDTSAMSNPGPSTSRRWEKK